MSNIGKKVRITRTYNKYIGQIGTISYLPNGNNAEDGAATVDMPDGTQLCPYMPKASNPECEWYTEQVQDLSIETLRGQNYLVNCKTQEEWNQMLQLLGDAGVLWCGGQNMNTKNHDNWSTYGSENCISIDQGTYSPAVHYPDHTIIQAADVIAYNNQNNTDGKQRTTADRSTESSTKANSR